MFWVSTAKSIGFEPTPLKCDITNPSEGLGLGPVRDDELNNKMVCGWGYASPNTRNALFLCSNTCHLEAVSGALPEHSIIQAPSSPAVQTIFL